jgi:hypothetical protein
MCDTAFRRRAGEGLVVDMPVSMSVIMANDMLTDMLGGMMRDITLYG